MIRFMNSPKLFLLPCLIILLIGRIKGEVQANFCSPNTYAQNSTSERNIILVLSSISTNANQSNGFYNTTAGRENNTVYGIFQCLGHATVQTCQKCASRGARDILQRCPNQKGAVSWYEECWIHFSGDEYFFNIMQELPGTSITNPDSATDTSTFMTRLSETLRVVAKEASLGGIKKFATQEDYSTAFDPLYTMAQCTPDISEDDCLKCLSIGIDDLPQCCYGRIGGRILKPSCYLRYETYAFYRAAPWPPAPPPPAPSKGQLLDSPSTESQSIL